MTEIIQADREAAADAIKAYRDQKNTNWQGRIRGGECDDGGMVQAFARHRIAERGRIVAWLRDGGGTNLSALTNPAMRELFMRGMNGYADAIERGDHHHD